MESNVKREKEKREKEKRVLRYQQITREIYNKQTKQKWKRHHISKQAEENKSNGANTSNSVPSTHIENCLEMCSR